MHCVCTCRKDLSPWSLTPCICLRPGGLELHDHGVDRDVAHDYPPSSLDSHGGLENLAHAPGTENEDGALDCPRKRWMA